MPTAASVATPWLTRTEAAAYVRVSLKTFDGWVREGRVRKHKVRGLQSVRFHRDALDALMEPAPERWCGAVSTATGSPCGALLPCKIHTVPEPRGWYVHCGCSKHGDHLGCTQQCADLGECQHPRGAVITATTEEEADRRNGQPL